MEIRSITVFCEAGESPPRFARFLEGAKTGLPFPVQSMRVATPPFPEWWGAPVPDGDRLESFVHRWRTAGFDYLGLGPVQLRHSAAWLELLPELVSAGGAVFATAEVAAAGTVDAGRCRQVADLIRHFSARSPDGLTNLYFAALAHCRPGSPFLPVAYHDGGPATFAVAVEAADLAVEACLQADGLADARDRLVAAVESAAARITRAAAALAERFSLSFAGVDFSLASFPERLRSLGTAFEALGVPAVGGPGSLFAAAFLADAVDRASFPRCGFSGLMLPVLEDATLAARAASGELTLANLLSYAAVCGTGLDTIPLPGATPAETIAGILLDLGALSARQRKPLTARLLPLPGLSAGDAATFDFPYFTNSAVMSPGAFGVRGHLAGPARLNFLPLDGGRRDGGR